MSYYMQRSYCSQCHYPQTTCVCEVVEPIFCDTQFDILQHPQERKSSKNTARLCQLCLPNLNIWLGEYEEDFLELRQQLQKEQGGVFVLYPGEHAVVLSERIAHASFQRPVRILLLDATWKKAYKMWQVNPWLHQLPAIALTHIEGQYDIRKSPSTGHLSTLEALAHTLALLEPGVNTAPLLNCFQAMQNHFKRHY